MLYLDGLARNRQGKSTTADGHTEFAIGHQQPEWEFRTEHDVTKWGIPRMALT
jgi:hypothetical protein